MQKSVGAMKFRQGLGELLNEVVYRGDEIIIERAGKPVAVLISMEEYEAFRHNREEAGKTLRRIWDKVGTSFDARETESLIAEAVQAVRKA